MKWKPQKGKRANRDVIDVRGAKRSSSSSSSGGLSNLPIPGGVGGLGGGIGTIVVIVVIALPIFGGGGSSGSGFDIGQILGGGATPPSAQDPQPIPPAEDPQKDLKDFSVYVFNDVQKTWKASFKADGENYSDAKLVLYSGAVNTGGCGSATSAVGPFYCPGDSKVYLDLSFYGDMKQQLGAPGDFAWAYVIAHEMGHHVQNELGTNAKVTKLTNENPGDANELSVRTELQADCYAGVWSATVFKQGDLEKGDLDEAFNAAEAVGDDRLQKQAGGSVKPDTFTHGTSAQRKHWFEAGYDSGDPSACDTFSPDSI
ncbi:neutral zinc metallopeptidase [soil metagenome]